MYKYVDLSGRVVVATHFSLTRVIHLKIMFFCFFNDRECQSLKMMLNLIEQVDTCHKIVQFFFSLSYILIIIPVGTLATRITAVTNRTAQRSY
jgi:hypothetical protein